MNAKTKHSAETAAFVSIANNLVDGYDAVDLFSGLTAHCATLLNVASAGLLLADGHGELHLMAASSEKTYDLEMFQLQRQEGPCLDCYHGGAAVSVSDLAQERQRWPQFVPAALESGFASVHALPMRLRDTVLGALGLFGTSTGDLDAEDQALAQALAHIASVALVAERATSDAAAINDQLQSALRSRVTIEQARGILAEDGNIDTAQALMLLRRYAVDHDQPLSQLARSVVAGEVDTPSLLDCAPPLDG